MSSDKKISSNKKTRCQVKGCTRKDSSIHRLPKHDFIRKIWIENLQLMSVNDPYVCGLHFEESDFCNGASKRRLRSIAVPSVNLPEFENVIEESGDEGVLMDSTIHLDESTIDEQTVMDSLVEDEVTIQIDSDYKEFISNEDNRFVEEKPLLAFQYHGKSRQTGAKYVDKCVQDNFTCDEPMRPCTLLEVLQTNRDGSCTGIQSDYVLGL